VSANVLPGTGAPHRDRLPASAAALENSGPGAPIARAVAAFVTEARSLPAGPVAAERSGSDALLRASRSTQAGFQFGTEGASGRIVWCTVTVRVTGVVHSADNIFEVRWEETIRDGGAAVRRERMRAELTVVLRAADSAPPASDNPPGLYVDKFVWWRDAATDGD
jgi:type IV secretory pathway TrbF-like protein